MQARLQPGASRGARDAVTFPGCRGSSGQYELRERRRRDLTFLPHPIADLERAEQARKRQRALARLNPEKREILLLARFSELKYDRIAALLGIRLFKTFNGDILLRRAKN